MTGEGCASHEANFREAEEAAKKRPENKTRSCIVELAQVEAALAKR